ncbi:MAG: hypothetical protein JXB08_05215 [Bacilli bacterium]|nr:hypothetical protein [Bacilli bacterium]MBN2876977.1 hypothetical protein [Bacilli bacterium]
MKFLKRFLIFLLVLVVAIVLVAFSFINSIRYEVTEADLPQTVYASSDDLLTYAKLKVVSLVLASADDRYTITEEFINIIIFDSIRENINSTYDPLNDDCTVAACDFIVTDEYYYLDYAYAELNEDNQLVVTISVGTNKIISAKTAIILVFDIEFDMGLDPKVVFTLDSYSLGEKQMSKSLLDRIFDTIGHQSVEDSMTFGDLNLTDYTYTISITDAMS